jgi:hypothetical protein
VNEKRLGLVFVQNYTFRNLIQDQFSEVCLTDWELSFIPEPAGNE